MTVPVAIPSPFRYNATVIEVHDIDTVICRIDWGFRRHDDPIPVRLLGGAGRELSEPGGEEAAAHLARLLPPGTPVVLHTAKPDKYAPRWLASVAYPLNGQPRDLVADLIADGWLVHWNGRGAQPKPPWPREMAA
ncbi:thermonuclease family protein [Geodermatophilus chilensis]|uniref:thermonuclease family protein n=1 Tax=Geodermatophilus chilensis TaxID=2035835 RepID=UPI000C26736B|nr:hypothetical protein [Geodermatophilus chilensis]